MARPVNIRIAPDQPLSDIESRSASAGKDAIKLSKPCSLEMAGEDEDTSNEDQDKISPEQEARGGRKLYNRFQSDPAKLRTEIEKFRKYRLNQEERECLYLIGPDCDLASGTRYWGDRR